MYFSKKNYVFVSMVITGAIGGFLSGCFVNTTRSAVKNDGSAMIPARQRIFDVDIIPVDPPQAPQCLNKTPVYIEFKIERSDARNVVITKLFQLREKKKISINVTTQVQTGYTENTFTSTSLRTHVFCLPQNITWDFTIDGEMVGEVTVDSVGRPTFADYVNHEP